MRVFIACLGIIALLGCQRPDRVDDDPVAASPMRLAFISGGEIWTVDGDGANPRKLVGDILYQGKAHDRPLTWSPDGSRLLFWKHSEVGWDIWSVNADGSDARNLTQVTSGGCRSPRWSPDGSRIAYMRDDPEGLHVMNADGSGAERLSQLGSRDEIPSWSPDGTRIVFVHVRRDAEGRFGTELIIADADGSDEVCLGERMQGSAWAPFWSRNGRWIFFAGPRNGNSDVCFFDPENGVEQNLTESPARESFPVPSPEGARIAYIAVEVDVSRLMVMDIDGRNPRELAVFEGSSGFPSWSPDGRRLVFMVDGPEGPPSIRVVDVNRRVSGASGLDLPEAKEIARGWFPVWQQRP